MKQTTAQRKRIISWKRQLRACTDSIAIEKPQHTSLHLLALNIAHIEIGIAGMLAAIGCAATAEILQATLEDIEASGSDASHWRSIEAHPQEVVDEGKTNGRGARYAKGKRQLAGL